LAKLAVAVAARAVRITASEAAVEICGMELCWWWANSSTSLTPMKARISASPSRGPARRGRRSPASARSHRGRATPREGDARMSYDVARMRSGLISVVYFIVGVVVAASDHYFTHISTLKPLLSALLAVVLWPLLLLGVNLHIK
jgi:hypothetical protein